MKALIKLTESNTLLKNGLQIQEINLQLKKNQNNGESLFKETLKVGKMFSESLTYFKSNDCKAILKANGNLIIKVEDFIWDCFGKKKVNVKINVKIIAQKIVVNLFSCFIVFLKKFMQQNKHLQINASACNVNY